jgi:hypothetical protein
MKPKKTVDTNLESLPVRGRPRRQPYSTVWGRAANYRTMLSEKWLGLGEPLIHCRNAEDVTKAFHEHGEPYAGEFVPRLASDIFELIKESGFPQRAKARIKYIAESIAGRPSVTLRRSRDICQSLRTQEGAKSPYKIIRKEFYVVCECGYNGPAENDACRKCGAQISFINDILASGGAF